jgi:hypothetical protein
LQLERQLYVALLAESLSKEEDAGEEGAAAAADGKASLAKLLKQGPPGDALTWRMCAVLCCWPLGELSDLLLFGAGCCFVEPSDLCCGVMVVMHANRLGRGFPDVCACSLLLLLLLLLYAAGGAAVPSPEEVPEESLELSMEQLGR